MEWEVGSFLHIIFETLVTFCSYIIHGSTWGRRELLFREVTHFRIIWRFSHNYILPIFIIFITNLQFLSSFLPHFGPGVHSTFSRNAYKESSLGVKGSRSLRLTMSPPCLSTLAHCLDNVASSMSHSPTGLCCLLQVYLHVYFCHRILNIMSQTPDVAAAWIFVILPFI
jgi:hypothetical protein